LSTWGGIFDVPSKAQELNQLELEMGSGSFWDDADAAKKTVDRVSALKNIVIPYNELGEKVDDFFTLAELIEEEGAGSELMDDAATEWPQLEQALDELELLSFLSGKYDSGNCFLSINAGAGGTESCDWADMLLRMYRRWAESKDYKVTFVSLLEGEEAGIKNCTMLIEGPMAFGYLKAERGVHRLVRVSPFDSNKRRHTSFTSIDVVPDIGDEADVDIDSKDLRVDTFRASGAGGQHVNTTDSAIRITHIPTGIVVSCQMERSQHKNRATAMKMLGAKLEELKQAEREAELDANSGEKNDIGWGSQIRSYVLDDRRVKDHRTNHTTSNTDKVLDGDLDPFIQSFLRSGLNKEENE